MHSGTARATSRRCRSCAPTATVLHCGVCLLLHDRLAVLPPSCQPLAARCQNGHCFCQNATAFAAGGVASVSSACLIAGSISFTSVCGMAGSEPSGSCGCLLARSVFASLSSGFKPLCLHLCGPALQLAAQSQWCSLGVDFGPAFPVAHSLCL